MVIVWQSCVSLSFTLILKKKRSLDSLAYVIEIIHTLKLRVCVKENFECFGVFVLIYPEEFNINSFLVKIAVFLNVVCIYYKRTNIS
jgi:hypothetical protein